MRRSADCPGHRSSAGPINNDFTSRRGTSISSFRVGDSLTHKKVLKIKIVVEFVDIIINDVHGKKVGKKMT